MADRSAASDVGVAGCADFCRASRRMFVPVGEASWAGVLGTTEKPVTTPLAVRLTSAVICCQRGFSAGCTCSPHYSTRVALMIRPRTGGSSAVEPGQVLEHGLDLRAARVLGVGVQQRRVLSLLRRRPDDPLLVDVRYQRGLPGRGRDGLGAQAGEARVPGQR